MASISSRFLQARFSLFHDLNDGSQKLRDLETNIKHYPANCHSKKRDHKDAHATKGHATAEPDTTQPLWKRQARIPAAFSCRKT